MDLAHNGRSARSQIKVLAITLFLVGFAVIGLNQSAAAATAAIAPASDASGTDATVASASGGSTCNDYQIGETRYHSAKIGAGTFHRSAINSYFVTRLEADHYQLSFDIRFSLSAQQPFQHPHYGRILSTAQIKRQQELDEKWRGRARECFAWFNETYRGDGQTRISLALRERGDRDLRFWRTVDVGLSSDKNGRSNSRLYATVQMEEGTKGCLTLIHEVLHLAGLEDEYIEEIKRTPTNKLMYDCRARSSSIMSYHWDFEKPQFVPSKLLLCACRMDASQTKCLVTLQNTKRELEGRQEGRQEALQACPEGSVELLREEVGPFQSDSKAEDMKTLIGMRIAPVNGQIYAGAETFQDGRSRLRQPLSPAHIRQLLYPACESRNPIYNACIANVYRTSTENGGEGCLPAPPVCSRLNEWLR